MHGRFLYCEIISVHINHQATKDCRISRSSCSASSWPNGCILKRQEGGGYAVLHCRVFHVPCCVMSRSRSVWNQELKKWNFEDICFFQLGNLIFHQGSSGSWSECAAGGEQPGKNSNECSVYIPDCLQTSWQPSFYKAFQALISHCLLWFGQKVVDCWTGFEVVPWVKLWLLPHTLSSTFAYNWDISSLAICSRNAVELLLTFRRTNTIRMPA